jgi:hypothetical protein
MAESRNELVHFGDGLNIVTVVRELELAWASMAGAQSRHALLRPAARALRRLAYRLRRPPRVALLGEFNSGKSSLANALIGNESLPTAVLSNTRIATLLYFAPAPEVSALLANGERRPLTARRLRHTEQIVRVDVGLPAPGLRTFEILDLPGLGNASSEARGFAEHAQIVDAVIWCTVGTQAWKESERLAWASLPQRLRSRGILAVTHWDLVRNPTDRAKLLRRLEGEVHGLFWRVTPIGTRDALRALGAGSHERIAREWAACGAADLDAALGHLVRSIMAQRVASALAVTRRIVHRTLGQLEDSADDLLQRAQDTID